MAVYLDSSAIVKLVVSERESGTLRRFLRQHPTRVSSALARVEVLRAVRFQGTAFADRARAVLARIQLLRVDDRILESACTLDSRVLRSLDAVHLASAKALDDELEWVVTYDHRMLDAAASAGIPTRSPGVHATGAPHRRAK